MNGSRAIAVLGGGITGLTAAFRLSQLGHRVRLFERSPRLGGAIRTEITNGWLVEAGPNSFQASDPAATALLEELRLGAEIVEPSAVAKNRYIACGRKLIAVPFSPGGLLGTSLFSTGAKLRILREFFSKPSSTETDLSVAEFIRRHFGAEVLSRVVQPFISGIYAGDAEALSTRHAFPKLWASAQNHGSVLRGQIAAAKARRAQGGSRLPAIVSFRRGLQTLPHALTTAMPSGVFSLNAHVERLVPGKSWQVQWREGETGVAHSETFDAVVSAVPAAALSRLVIGAGSEQPLASLAGIPHPPVSSLFLGFKREHVAHALDGFGALVPATERRSILGVIFSSSLFPDRAPAGHVAVTVFVGGTLQPALATLPEPQLMAAVMADLRELLGVAGEPVFHRHTLWPAAIPQYTLGYETVLATIGACERAHPGLFIGGQVRDGIALPSCIAAGENLAERSVAFNPS
jgi:protoporphyrinogen/coproporphyrinogen III oxidase